MPGLSPLPDVMVLEEVTPFPDPLAPWEALWDELSEQQWEKSTVSQHSDGAQGRAAASHPLPRLSLIKDGTQEKNTLDQTSGSQLS